MEISVSWRSSLLSLRVLEGGSVGCGKGIFPIKRHCYFISVFPNHKNFCPGWNSYCGWSIFFTGFPKS